MIQPATKRLLGGLAVVALVATTVVVLLLWSPWEREPSASLTAQEAVITAGHYMNQRYGGGTGCLSAEYNRSLDAWVVACMKYSDRDCDPNDPSTVVVCPEAESRTVLVDDSTSRAYEPR